MFRFAAAIVDATADLALAYKVNTAFFECEGVRGWQLMERIAAILPTSALRIADCKRGDIGHTSGYYAKTFFQELPFDAVTVHPYMGHDSAQPFLDYTDKWTFLLGLTSNPGAADFEQQQLETGEPLWQRVLHHAEAHWQRGNLGYVVGATRSEAFREVRLLVPNAPLLVPGVGAQGGDAEAVVRNGYAGPGSLLVNASRAILYASEGSDFAEAARTAALNLTQALRKAVEYSAD